MTWSIRVLMSSTLLLEAASSSWMHRLGEDAGRAGLAYAPGAAEQIGMGELPPDDGVLEGLDNCVLSDKGFEGIRTVFPGRDYILRHNFTTYVQNLGLLRLAKSKDNKFARFMKE